MSCHRLQAGWAARPSAAGSRDTEVGLVGIQWRLEGTGEPRLPTKRRLQSPESKARGCPGCDRTHRRPQPSSSPSGPLLVLTRKTGCQPKRPASSLLVTGFIR